MKKPYLEPFVLWMGLLSLGALPYNDPTRPSTLHPVVKGSAISSAFDLSGIFIYPTYNLAIINGNALKLGEVINEYTITRIDANTVELESKTGNREHLSLVEGFKTKAGK